MSPDAQQKRSLKDRLRQAVNDHVKAGDAQPRGGESAGGNRDAPKTRQISGAADQLPLEDILDGKWHETEFGPTFIKDQEFPLDHSHGTLPLSSLLAASTPAFKYLLPNVKAPRPESFGFFDIETTGLSAGTGTYCFLAALGTFNTQSFRVRQYFLADLRQERAMMALMAKDLQRCEVIVTYNGRSFDLPCIDTRMLLTRFPSPFGDLHDLDVLYAVRRLYRRRLESCRLAEAEQNLIQFRRPDDIPGWMAPNIYFDYLRAQRIAPLRGVFRHNSDDILSTLGILAHVVKLLENADPAPRDAVFLARWWEYSEAPERARQLYARALSSLEDEADWSWAAERYAQLCKRAGERGTAVPLWRRLWEQGHRPAGLELAKHLEHRERDFPLAASIAERLLADADGEESAALEHRIARLKRKQSRQAQQSSSSSVKATVEEVTVEIATVEEPSDENSPESPLTATGARKIREVSSERPQAVKE